MTKKTFGLIIMDGFGYPENLKLSAIQKSNTKNLRALAGKYPSTLLYASEGKVGLPKNQTGTSETGHLNIGTGRIIDFPLVGINKEIKSGKFFKNPVLVGAMNNAKIKGRSLHLMGIPTDGGVHGHQEHLYALIKMASEFGVKNVFIHFFADGRDTPPQSALKYVKKLQSVMTKYNCGKIATVIGRLYALDRDNNWDRVKVAYDAMVYGEGYKATNATDAIKNAYARGETDEFIKATVITQSNNPIAVIKKGDSVISYNYRADRERQLAYAFDPSNKLDYTNKNLKTKFVCMCEYDENLKFCEVAYKSTKQKNILSEILSKRGYKQLKIAETEKAAYITFSFNDGKVEPFLNEHRIIVNSIKLKKYDSKPEMSAYEIKKEILAALEQNEYDVIIVNFANADMVGHSGVYEAAKKAIKVVDECVNEIAREFIKRKYSLIITADHGNSDQMMYEDGSPHTAHTTAKVPFILVDDNYKNAKLKKGGNLGDISPTLLYLMNEEKPKEMTGHNLIKV